MIFFKDREIVCRCDALIIDALITLGAAGFGAADCAVAIERAAFTFFETEPVGTIGIRLTAGFAVALGDANRGFAG